MKANIETQLKTLQRKENQFGSGGLVFRDRNRAVRPNCIFSLAVLCSILMSVSANFCQAQITAGGTATILSGFVVGVTVTNGGSGYSVPPTVNFTGGGGSGAIAFAQITNGYVSSINVSNTGSGYSTPPTVVIEPPLFDLNDTLVGYWPFEGNVNDASGKGGNGTVSGSISYPAGTVGKAAAFNGATYVDFDDPSDGRYDIAPGQNCYNCIVGQNGNVGLRQLAERLGQRHILLGAVHATGMVDVFQHGHGGCEQWHTRVGKSRRRYGGDPKGY